ncbi:hypothetical protein pb186bvf_000037 [Paramecium bursaria]
MIQQNMSTLEEKEPMQEQNTKIYPSKSPIIQRGKSRQNLVFPENIKFDEKVDDEEKYLSEDHIWEPTDTELSLESIKKDEMDRFRTSWSWLQFIEFYFYHILYYNFLGPFMIPFILIKPGLTLMRNMQFWGLSQQYFLQTFIWFGSMVVGLGYFIFENSIITLTEVLFLWYAVIIRTAVIASKYATFTPDKILLYKKLQLEDQILAFDLMLNDWREQSKKILFLEQYRSIKRKQFEVTQFKFDFIAPPHPKTVEGIRDVEIEYYQDMNIVLENSQQFNGFQLFGYLVQQYKNTHDSNNAFKFATIEALIFSVTPTLIKLPQLIEDNITYVDAIRIIIGFFISTFAFFGSYVFFHLGYYDFNRKFYLNDQCLYMIQSTNRKFTYPKAIPTMNFNNLCTLQAWSMIRSMSFDYGDTFNQRTQGFFSLVFLGFMFLIFIAFFLILDLVTLSLFQSILLGELGILIISFTIYYLYLAARLNSYFQCYEISLEELKSVYQDILRMTDAYFVQNKEPINFIHKKFIQLLRIQSQGNLKEVEEIIDDVIYEIEDNLRLLEIDKKNNPFKLYGVPITYNLLKSAGVAISTLFSFALQQRLLGN